MCSVELVNGLGQHEKLLYLLWRGTDNQKKEYMGWAPVPPASESPEFKHGSEDKE